MHDVPEDVWLLLARETHLADIGELAGPLTHEFNNLLNNVTFQLEIMKQSSPESAAADFASLRSQLRQTAALIAHFQRCRGGNSLESTVDLNRVLSWAAQTVSRTPPALAAFALPRPQCETIEVVNQVNAGDVTVSLDLQNDLPPVRGQLADVLRLCRFLLNNAVRSGGAVRARTRWQGPAVEVVIEDDGPEVAEVLLPHIFEPGQSGREGMSGLEMAACRSILRRLMGRIDAHTPATGGLQVVVTFVEQDAALASGRDFGP
jgi:signal transduction histidine kinase